MKLIYSYDLRIVLSCHDFEKFVIKVAKRNYFNIFYCNYHIYNVLEKFCYNYKLITITNILSKLLRLSTLKRNLLRFFRSLNTNLMSKIDKFKL